jgi:hypothetical protein
MAQASADAASVIPVTRMARRELGVQVFRVEASPRTLNPERPMRRVPLFVLLLGSCIPLHPSYAQGWIEIEGRQPGVPAGSVSRVGSRVTITVEDRLARVQVEERFRRR